MNTKLPTLLLASISAFFFSPAAFAQVPTNDLCADAIMIDCGAVVQGNTEEATADDNAIDCGTSIAAPGVWYRFEGNDQAITLTTCGDVQYDTKLNVYLGGCDALVCVAGNDDGGDCGVGSTLGFAAMSGTTYYILVQGYDGEVGAFELAVSCGPFTYDLCTSATPIGCGEIVGGSTLEATEDNAPACVTGIQAAGVWFTFTGIDQAVQLSTCGNSDYDTRINVYTGSCDALECVTGNDDTDGVGTCSTVTVIPALDQTYFVLVQGYQGETGTFDLELACISCPAPYNVDVSASDVSAFLSWDSFNTGATYTIEYGPVGFEPGSGQTIGGTVGDDPMAQIDGLDPATDYAFYVQEDCGEGDLSALSGPIEFTTLELPPATNATCSGALPIACDDALEGDTGMSYRIPGPACGSAPITAPGLWYTFIGEGNTVSLSTCGTAAFDTKLSVFSGDCSMLTCVTGNDDAPNCDGNTSFVEFQAIDGEPYLVFVHGYEDNTGTFTLTMTCAPTCAPLAENDVCGNATVLIPVGLGLCEGVQGNNACAFANGIPNPPCEEFLPAVDVWFAFNSGEQSDFLITIEAQSAAELNGAFYTDCEGLEILGCANDISGTNPIEGLDLNTTYYIRIWNAGGEDAGTFSLCLETDLFSNVAEASGEDGFLVWPNPAEDLLWIHGAASNALAIFDMQGRAVRTTSTNKAERMQVDISDLASGPYLLRELDGARPRTIRFVKP